MKKFIIILISVILLLSSFAVGFFVKKSVDDKTILKLTYEIRNLQSNNNNLQNKIKASEDNEKKENNQEKYKHPIDIEEERCIANSHVYNLPICEEKAEKSWDKEIQKNLKLIQKVMSNEEFDYIRKMNDSWNKSAYDQIESINRFISSKDGIIHQTDGQNNIVLIKKQYALLLKSIYYNYYEEDSELLN